MKIRQAKKIFNAFCSSKGNYWNSYVPNCNLDCMTTLVCFNLRVYYAVNVLIKHKCYKPLCEIIFVFSLKRFEQKSMLRTQGSTTKFHYKYDKDKQYSPLYFLSK